MQFFLKKRNSYNQFFGNFTGIVNFNHTFGCQKCLTEGTFYGGAHRMSFPKTGEEKRTDNNFRNPTRRCKSQIEHHKEYSILQELDIDMITSFPVSDPLHLLELEIMKKYAFILSYNSIS